MKLLKALTIIVLAMAAAAGVKAQEQQGANGEAFTFMRLDRSPVTSAMAGAGFSMTKGNFAYSAFGNPAAAAFMDKTVSAAANYRSWAPGILDEQHITAAFAVKPIGDLAIIAGYTKGIQPQLDEEDPFRPNDNNFTLGASYAITSSIGLGVNWHYVYQSLLEDYKLSGWAVDAVAHYAGDNFNLAGGVVSIGPKVVSQQSGAYPLPASAKIAGDYTLSFDAIRITAAADADYYFNSGNWGVSGGAEVGLAGMVFFRAGGRYAPAGSAIPTHIAVGGGLKYRFITLDMSYITMNSIIGNSIMGGISISL